MTTTASPPAVDHAAVAALVDAIDHEAEARYRDALVRRAVAADRERGWSEGYAAAIADVKAAEHGAVAAVRLEGARRAPAGAAWLAAVERHGGTEYGGTGKPRVPVPPAVIERARRDLEGRPR